MMRIIKGQTMMSTHTDSHGEKLTYEELKQLFDSQPEEMLINVHHSLGEPPAGKGFNKSLVQLEDGEYAIKMDIEVWDEERIKGFGGFSGSFKVGSLTLDANQPPDVEILLNPRHYADEVFQDVIQYSTPDLHIWSTKLKQKSTDPLPYVILLFVVSQIAGGFFKEIGSDAYKALRKKISSLPFETKSGTPGSIQIRAPFEHWEHKYQVIIEISAPNQEGCEQSLIELKSAREYVERLLADTDLVSSVIITNQPNPPYWRVKHVVAADGRAIGL